MIGTESEREIYGSLLLSEQERGEGKRPTVDVIIPVYQPDRKFSRLLSMLGRQKYPVNRIIIMNTESAYWNGPGYEGIAGMEIHHISRSEFDHGATRNRGAGYSEADILLFMTDDAVPRDDFLTERLVRALEQKGPNGETAAVAYARQLPAGDCRTVERITREFNYPEQGRVKTKSDLESLGIKTYFASNVCCAYRRDIFDRLGGFISPTIFNEDMIYAAKAINAGYAVVYAADAKVVHSHDLTLIQQFRRNFDLAVSQAEHPEVFRDVPSEGEGIRLMKQTARKLIGSGRFWLIPYLILSGGVKYMGYRMGKIYRRLPRRLLLFCTGSPLYWEKP